MGGKDYYEVLQIHPSAEPFMVVSAYRRLTREYHPDVDPSPQAHQRMILINEAYAVLSDPEQRRQYDQSRTRGARVSAPPEQEKSSSRARVQETQSHAVSGAPTSPNPADFGIADNYFAKANEGATAWKVRKPVVAPRLQFALRLGAWVGGAAIAYCRKVIEFYLPDQVLAWAWLALPSIAECVLQVIETVGDAKRLKNHYNPKFNPNPMDYAKYANALAEYETQIASVYVSRSWKYHTDPHCYGMMSSSEMPRWDAEKRGAQACSRCGYYIRRTVALPPPFGPRSGPASQSDPPHQLSTRGQRKWWQATVYAVAGCSVLLFLSGQKQTYPDSTTSALGASVASSNSSWPTGHDQGYLPSSSNESPSGLSSGFYNQAKDQSGNSRVLEQYNSENIPAQGPETIVAEDDGDSHHSVATDPLPFNPVVRSRERDQYSRDTEREASLSTSETRKSITRESSHSRSGNALTSSLPESSDLQARERLVKEIKELGEDADASEDFLTLSDRLMRIRKANELKAMGLKAYWRQDSFLVMSDREMRFRKAEDLAALGYTADAARQSYLEMSDIEMRIRKARDLKLIGIDLDWTKHSWLEMSEIERKARRP